MRRPSDDSCPDLYNFLVWGCNSVILLGVLLTKRKPGLNSFWVQPCGCLSKSELSGINVESERITMMDDCFGCSASGQ